MASIAFIIHSHLSRAACHARHQPTSRNLQIHVVLFRFLPKQQMASRRNRRVTVKSNNEAVQTTSNADFKYTAADNDRPSPVHNAMSAARQSGHLGMNTKTANGAIQANTSRTRRIRVLRLPA